MKSITHFFLNSLSRYSGLIGIAWIAAIFLAASYHPVQAQETCRCLPLFEPGQGENPDSVLVDTCGANIYPRPCSEGILWRRYITYARKWWSVRFLGDAIPLSAAPSDTVIEVGWRDIDPAYQELRSRFEMLEMRFGEFHLRKVYPADTDEVRGREFRMRFDEYVNADSVNDMLEAIPGIIPQFTSAIGSVLGVEESGDGDIMQFDLYPNPARNFIQIEIRDDGDESPIQIGNTSGLSASGIALEYLPGGSRAATVDISSLPQGMYYVRYHHHVRRFVIVR